ncbi:hypothetical protein OnM2_039083 [Erysiphe neolycopersici]|uniref:Uncharacterized protein n=1 Tax=Erysiphe neolycopersici TaxID=212602 RepID=A0A420HW73_9PEZI|nr:hypothetical protein OnM2_039083 [Erysiphe neolycopersici]
MISSVDSTQRPSDQIMKNRLLNFFDTCSDGCYSGSVTVLRNDLLMTFIDCVGSLRKTQKNFELKRSGPTISLVRNVGNSSPQFTVSLDSLPSSSNSSMSYKGVNKKSITLDDVWLLPECTRNSIPVSQLFTKGYRISSSLSSSGISVLSPSNFIMATAVLKNGLFCFNTSASTSDHTLPTSSFFLNPLSDGYSNALISSNFDVNTCRLIHYRFAHVGSHLLKKLNIESFKFPFQDKNKLGDFKKNLSNCDVCCSCKQVEKINRT